MLKFSLPIPRLLSVPEVIAGKGMLGTLKALSATKALVIASPSLLKDEAIAKRIERVVGAIETRVVPKSGGEPTWSSIQALSKQAMEFRPDWIVAIGGGAVLDAAKLAWAFYEHPELEMERATRPFGLPSLRGKCRLAAIPTTAGTGSEVSSSASFADDSTHEKRFVVSHDLIPDLVILDPDLLASTPATARAASGMDAVGHALEGYVSKLSNPMADSYAEQALRTLFRELPKTSDSSTETLLSLQIAALQAGYVQNAKIPGVGHALAHAIATLGVPHGNGVAHFLPLSIELNSETEAVKNRYALLAERLGFKNIEGLLRATVELREQLEIGKPSVNLVKEKDGILDRALADICMKANPVAINREQLERALEKIA